MNRNIYLILMGVILSSCATVDQKWADLYSREEKIKITTEKAEKAFKEGKEKGSFAMLTYSRSQFLFLDQQFQHLPAKQRVNDVDEFLSDFHTYYSDLFNEAMKKDNVMLAAVSSTKILQLFPETDWAKKYLEVNILKIEESKKKVLDQAKKQLQKGEISKAEQSFTQILTIEPESKDALSGIDQISQIKKKNKTTATSSPAAGKKDDNKSPTNMAEVYAKAVKAYEQKDYVSAYKLFLSLDDPNYKDTNIYLQRTADKIEALGLDVK